MIAAGESQWPTAAWAWCVRLTLTVCLGLLLRVGRGVSRRRGPWRSRRSIASVRRRGPRRPQLRAARSHHGTLWRHKVPWQTPVRAHTPWVLTEPTMRSKVLKPMSWPAWSTTLHGQHPRAITPRTTTKGHNRRHRPRRTHAQVHDSRHGPTIGIQGRAARTLACVCWGLLRAGLLLCV